MCYNKKKFKLFYDLTKKMNLNVKQIYLKNLIDRKFGKTVKS